MILGVFSYTRERILNIHQRVIFCKFFLLKNLLYFLYSYSEQRSLISSDYARKFICVLVVSPPENGRSFYLGFITNPKNGRVKGLNEVSLDRTYYVESPISEQKKGIENHDKNEGFLTDPYKFEGFVWFEKESGTGTTWGSILEELDICQ